MLRLLDSKKNNYKKLIHSYGSHDLKFWNIDVDSCAELVKELRISTSSVFDLPAFVVFQKGVELARFPNETHSSLSKAPISTLLFFLM